MEPSPGGAASPLFWVVSLTQPEDLVGGGDPVGHLRHQRKSKRS